MALSMRAESRRHWGRKVPEKQDFSDVEAAVQCKRSTFPSHRDESVQQVSAYFLADTC